MPQLFQRPWYLMGYLGVQLGLLIYNPHELGYNHYNYCYISNIIHLSMELQPQYYPLTLRLNHNMFQKHSSPGMLYALLWIKMYQKKCSRTHPPVIAQNYSAPLQIQKLYSQYWMMGTFTESPCKYQQISWLPVHFPFKPIQRSSD